MRSQLHGEVLLGVTLRKRDDVVSRLGGELDGKMSQATDA